MPSQILNNTTTQFNNIRKNTNKRHILKGNRKHFNLIFLHDINRLIRECNNLCDFTHSTYTSHKNLHTWFNQQINAKIGEKQMELKSFHRNLWLLNYTTFRSINNSKMVTHKVMPQSLPQTKSLYTKNKFNDAFSLTFNLLSQFFLVFWEKSF